MRDRYKKYYSPYIEDKYACLVDLPQTNNLINQNIDSKEEPIDPVAEFNNLFNTLEKIS